MNNMLGFINGNFGMSAISLLMALFMTACDSNSSNSLSTGMDNPQAPSNPDTQPPPTHDPIAPFPLEEGKLNVLTAYPTNEENRIALVTRFVINFDAELIEGLNTSQLVKVYLDGASVEGAVSQSAPSTLEFQSSAMLAPSQTYAIELDPSLMSAEGLPLVDDARWEFTTIKDVFTTSQGTIDQCMSDLDVDMLAAVNAARTQSRNCGEDFRAATGKLAWNCLLQESAIAHSIDMATNDFFSHTGSDGSNVGDRVTRTGYPWTYVGENLAAGQRSVTEVMDGLLDSPGHCLNIMAPNFTQFGFGYRVNDGTEYKRYWTQNFGRPHN